MKRRSIVLYSIRVCLTTTLLSPILAVLLSLNDAHFASAGDIKYLVFSLLAFLLYSAVFMIPSWGLFLLFCVLIRKGVRQDNAKRTILLVLGLLIVMLDLMVARGEGVSITKPLIVLLFCYSFVVTPCIFLFRGI